MAPIISLTIYNKKYMPVGVCYSKIFKYDVIPYNGGYEWA